MKTLKKWNGRGHGKYDNKHINVCAYSRAEAARLVATACGVYYQLDHELKVYYAQCWGNSMDGIEPTEPAVYVEGLYKDAPPERVL